MKKTRWMKSLSLILCMVLITAMALCMTGCNDNAAQPTDGDTAVTTTTTAANAGVTVLGEGATVFTFTVTDKDGGNTVFEIHTDKETVGDALLEHDLIAGEDGDYGLYVKTVNGITADYNVDGTYWAFYVNGEYAMSGVDTTTVEAGASYAFKVE